MTTPRTILATAALIAAVSPAAAMAGSHGITQQSSLHAGNRAPATVFGTSGTPSLHFGDKLHRGQTLLRYRVDMPAKAKKQMTFTCPRGLKVRGTGGRSTTGVLAVDGHDSLGKRSYSAKVGAENAPAKPVKGTFVVLCS